MKIRHLIKTSFNMKITKRAILLAVCMAASHAANAQSEQWKAYLDICGQFRADMTPCEKMEVYARMDSLFDGHMPDYNNLYNYMISSFLCGDTMTFKRFAFENIWNQEDIPLYGFFGGHG